MPSRGVAADPAALRRARRRAAGPLRVTGRRHRQKPASAAGASSSGTSSARNSSSTASALASRRVRASSAFSLRRRAISAGRAAGMGGIAGRLPWSLSMWAARSASSSGRRAIAPPPHRTRCPAAGSPAGPASRQGLPDCRRRGRAASASRRQAECRNDRLEHRLVAERRPTTGGAGSSWRRMASASPIARASASSMRRIAEILDARLVELAGALAALAEDVAEIG